MNDFVGGAPPVHLMLLFFFFFFFSKDSCVSPEGSLSLLNSVRLAFTVQASGTAASRRRFSAHPETCAQQDLSGQFPARQGPTRSHPDRCLSVLNVFTVAECKSN